MVCKIVKLPKMNSTVADTTACPFCCRRASKQLGILYTLILAMILVFLPCFQLVLTFILRSVFISIHSQNIFQPGGLFFADSSAAFSLPRHY